MAEPQGGVSKSDYSFGQVAIRENICTFDQVKECLDIQSKLRGLGIEPKKLGEILIEKGYVTPEQAVQVARLQAQSAASQKLAVPGYELLSKIGAGAMGTVYKARQISMDRMVAIKILSSRYAKDTTFVDRFVREARAVAKLNHENIIGGIDVGEAGGHHYFVMEYVDGAPVTAMMKRDGKIEEKRCLQIAMQIGKALSHAHKHGIVHRDIKPENIMIASGGVAKLCDLGLAKQTKGDADVTMDGTSVGTPNYISPEQARGEDKIDIRSDIYSLGASLYHMATGTTPFSGANPMVVMTKHVTEMADPPKRRLPSISEGFSNLVMRMMQKRREDRYQDPDALVADIDRLLRGADLAQASPAAPAPARSTVTVRPATDHGGRRGSSTVRREGLIAPGKSTSSRKLLAIGAIAAVGIVAAVILINSLEGAGGGSEPYRGKADSSTTARTTPNLPPPVDAGEKLKKETADFRAWAENQIVSSNSDRFTAPYSQLQKKIAQYKTESNFSALKAWQDEQGGFIERANKFITEKVWEPIRHKADEDISASKLSRALEELSKLDDVYKYLGESRQEKTRAAAQLEEWIEKVEKLATQTWLEGKQNAEKLFGDSSGRDHAYTSLDNLSASVLPKQKENVESLRGQFFQMEINDLVGTVPTPEKIKTAQARVAKLRSMHAGNEVAVATLDGYAIKLKTAYEDFSKSALDRANSLYSTGFRPKFEEAMRQRDLVMIRRHLTTIYFAKETADLQTYLLPASTDLSLLKSFCDPARAAPMSPADLKKLFTQAEEGWKVASKPGQSEGGRDLYFDLRTTLLLEDLVEQALEGVKFVNHDGNRFKSGYSAQLRDAVSADPVRKPNEGCALAVNLGAKGTVTLSVVPKKEPAVPEEDLVALAGRAPSAASDPAFALKAFFLFQYAGKLPSAKAWFDKLTAEQKTGLEKFAEGLKDTVSAAAELEAKTLYEEAHALWKKKDEIGAKRKFKECLDKYYNTAYMKSPLKLSSGDRSRIQIVEDLFKLSAPGGSPRSSSRAKLTDIFSATEVRDLGRGKYDVLFTFKDDREMSAFQIQNGAFGIPGQVTASRGPNGGVRVAGAGMWTSPFSLRGDVTCEMQFRMVEQKPLGFVVHGKSDRAGYAIMVHFGIPGAGQIDGVFRMPIELGPQFLNSILTSGGKDLDLVKDLPSTARLERTGTKIKLGLNRGSIEADNNQFNDGKVGLFLPDSTVQIDKIRIVGEVDRGWLETATKAAEALSPQK